jgi:hypothetical protein
MLKVHVEKGARPHLKELISRAPEVLTLVEDPAGADVIIFESDEPVYIRKTPEYQNYKEKCIVVSEIDLPTYFLPACYAAVNNTARLGKGRTMSIPYLLSQISVPNPFIGEISATAERKYLYSFRGGATSWVRKKMLKVLASTDDTLIQDSNFYRHWNFDTGYASEKLNHQSEYANVLASSSFVLCPRGAGVSSIRLFEVMRAGRVPVILADNWTPVPGIPWEEFALFIPENKITELDQIIRSKQGDALRMGAKAREAWQKYCSPGADGALLAKSIKELVAMTNKSREARIRAFYPAVEVWSNLTTNARATARNMILRTFSLLGVKFPYSLNR